MPTFFLFVIFELPQEYMYRGSKNNNNNIFW